MVNIAIIPARGGSKRIPRKNIRNFLGKPIIAYSIEVAIASGLFDEVIVSTDSEEIANVSIEYGASVPFFRSDFTSNDFSTLAEVIDEVKSELEARGKSCDNICCLLPTAPFVTVSLLAESLKMLRDNNIDSIKPIVRFSYPIQRAIKIEDGLLSMFQPEHALSRSQDLEPAFHDAGQFYWMTFEKGMRGKRKKGFEISEHLVHDIDTEDDWKIAEIKYKHSFG